MTAKLLGSGLLLALLAASPVRATPTEQPLLVDESLVVVETAQSAWSEEVTLPAEGLLPLDEQIFNELSPLIDSLESVRLPEDQSLDL